MHRETAPNNAELAKSPKQIFRGAFDSQNKLSANPNQLRLCIQRKKIENKKKVIAGTSKNEAHLVAIVIANLECRQKL